MQSVMESMNAVMEARMKNMIMVGYVVCGFIVLYLCVKCVWQCLSV